MKKTYWVAVFALMVCFILAIGFLTNPQNDDDSDILYAVGKNGTVTIEEYVAEYNEKIFISYDEETAKSMAETECFKMEALYQEALRLGYEVSKSELKEDTEFVILTNFGGDEDFFDQFVEYIYESMDIYEQVHEKEMIVELYEEDLEESWNGEDNTFEEYLDKVVNELVEAEDFKLKIEDIDQYLIDDSEKSDSYDSIELEGGSASAADFLPKIHEVESIDVVTGGVPAVAVMKSITEDSDIEMLINMLKSITVKRVAEESEYNLIGGIVDCFILRLNNGNSILVGLAGKNIMWWNDVPYYVDINDATLLNRYNNDFWSQLDYMEFAIGSDGLSELSKSNGKNKITGRKYTFKVEAYTGISDDVFTINIFADGTFSYKESSDSEYMGFGEWIIEDEKYKLIENKGTENERVNYFSIRGNDLLYIKDSSDNFSKINVAHAQRFNGEVLVEKFE